MNRGFSHFGSGLKKLGFVGIFEFIEAQLK